MCGLTGIFGFKGSKQEARAIGIKLSRRQKHRGPDSMRIEVRECKNKTYNILVHERLSI